MQAKQKHFTVKNHILYAAGKAVAACADAGEAQKLAERMNDEVEAWALRVRDLVSDRAALEQENHQYREFAADVCETVNSADEGDPRTARRVLRSIRILLAHLPKTDQKYLRS